MAASWTAWTACSLPCWWSSSTPPSCKASRPKGKVRAGGRTGWTMTAPIGQQHIRIRPAAADDCAAIAAVLSAAFAEDTPLYTPEGLAATTPASDTLRNRPGQRPRRGAGAAVGERKWWAIAGGSTSRGRGVGGVRWPEGETGHATITLRARAGP